MSDEVFRQSRRKITAEDLNNTEENPLDRVKQMQEAISKDQNESFEQMPPIKSTAFKMSGDIPPQLQQAIYNNMSAGKPPEKPPKNIASNPQEEDDDDEDFVPVKQPVKKKVRSEPKMRATGSEELETLLAKISNKHVVWREVDLPSKGKFYDNIPAKLNIRPMTGEEEIYLATPSIVRKGKAVDMIFEKCIKEFVNTQDLLSVDRTFLLVFLRGISYTPEYDVEIKCPNCTKKYNSMIDLNAIEVNGCPNDFGIENLVGVLPNTGFNYKFRLSVGDDEQAITRYREARVREYGEQNEDDTLLYRTAQLLEYVEGVTDKHELQLLLKKLPINDVSHLRNAVSDPPFGIDTQIGQICPYCMEEFEIDLPLESNFFFPRKKKDKTPQ